MTFQQFEITPAGLVPAGVVDIPVSRLDIMRAKQARIVARPRVRPMRKKHPERGDAIFNLKIASLRIEALHEEAEREWIDRGRK